MTERKAGPGNFGREAGEGFSGASRGLALAFGFTLPVILLWLGGRAVDGALGSDPWAQIVGTIIGWVVGFFYVYYATQRSDV